MTSGTISSGSARCATALTRADREPNATTNVTRYSESGMTHNSGTVAMSVERYVVTASIRLDGAKASATHRARRVQEIAFVGAASVGRSITAGRSAVVDRVDHATAAHA